ncbi:ferredoxin reductase family protein [Candidatus Solirubrobacter pratensis]|uniref:ferredoxin reductase family protein n=1 Tax=Candidatus Solirubrobacter pratensis TaxID=1298857 RepID=UPI0004831CCD|nr:ferredoxin reductase family protein [Candidatus Solirubrobacter pratensis]
MVPRMLALLGFANAVAVVALWLHGGGLHDEPLTSLGRLTGLLGAYLSLVELLVLARGPRTSAWHRWAGHAVLWLLIAHTVLITTGYARSDDSGLLAQARRLIEEFPGVITATAGLAILIGVVIASALRRRLRYETWYFIHLYTYLAIVLAFSHQLATGTEFVGDSVARTYWYALYGVTLAAIVWRYARARPLRVERVVDAGPGVVNIELAGRLRARPGQFFRWRFLTRGRWFEAHPFSLSATPDGHGARITVKGVGDHSRGLRDLRPGTRVLADGPFGGFTRAARRRPRAALIAGGAGITPIRALLEEMPGDLVVVYRAPRAEDVILRDELDALAAARGFSVHYVVGGDRDGLLALVPDIAERDVYVCGPPEMVDAMRARLRAAGVRRIVTERFAL